MRVTNVRAVVTALVFSLVMSGGALAQSPYSGASTDPSPPSNGGSARETTEDFMETGRSPRDLDIDSRQSMLLAIHRAADALKDGEYQNAMGYLSRALEREPGNPTANYLMAVAKIGIGSKAESLGYLDVAIRNRLNYVEARALLAKMLAQGGDRAGAREQLDALRAMQSACSGMCDSDALIRALGELEPLLA